MLQPRRNHSEHYLIMYTYSFLFVTHKNIIKVNLNTLFHFCFLNVINYWTCLVAAKSNTIATNGIDIDKFPALTEYAALIFSICLFRPEVDSQHRQQTEEPSVRHGSVSLHCPELLHHPWTGLRPKTRGRT